MLVVRLLVAGPHSWWSIHSEVDQVGFDGKPEAPNVMVGENKAVALLAAADTTYVSQSRSDPHMFSSSGPQEYKASMLQRSDKGSECMIDGVSSFHHCQGFRISPLPCAIVKAGCGRDA